MDRYDLTHLTDDAVDLEWTRSVDLDRSSTADMLARLAEYDARKLYLRAGYPSMYAYCVTAKNFCESAARKGIHAARTARRFPALFVALAEGRLHLTGVVMLAPHLHPDNFDELVTACTRRTAAQIEQILNARVVRLETLTEGVTSCSPNSVSNGAAESRVPSGGADLALIDPQRTATCVAGDSSRDRLPPREPAPLPSSTAPRPEPEPAFLVRLEKRAHDKLEYARALLSHRMPLASASQVLERALDDLIAHEEKRKCAATEKPRAPRPSRRARSIPAHVKRAVWKRDRGRCTFVGSDGHLCDSRAFLEYDHVDPVARGGEASVDRVRLRCRAHNQYEAERAFGAEFMKRKREQARGGRALARGLRRTRPG